MHATCSSGGSAVTLVCTCSVLKLAGQVAAYCYQDRLFDKDVRELYTAAMLGWRRRFRERLDLIAARYPPRIAVDLDELADMLSAIAEGGIVVSKVMRQKTALSQQLMLYREFIRAVFLGT